MSPQVNAVEIRIEATKYGRQICFGGKLYVYQTAQIPAASREYYVSFGPPLNQDAWSFYQGATIGNLVAALELPGAYDYALPQNFWNEYFAQHGEAPRGIWYYPPCGEPDHLYGKFISLQDIYYRLAAKCEKLLATYPV